MDAKRTVRELLERLPDDCSVEDVLYHLYVLNEVEQGQADIEAGRVLSQDDVAQKLRRKWVLGAAG